MIGRDTAQVFAYPPKAIKKRLKELRKVDHEKYSESRVVVGCLERCLVDFEKEAGIFKKPTQVMTPGRRKRAAA